MAAGAVGGDSGIGRAAAIAYAREGTDVAINYLPAEEPDAQAAADASYVTGQIYGAAGGRGNP